MFSQSSVEKYTDADYKVPTLASEAKKWLQISQCLFLRDIKSELVSWLLNAELLKKKAKKKKKMKQNCQTGVNGEFETLKT